MSGLLHKVVIAKEEDYLLSATLQFMGTNRLIAESIWSTVGVSSNNL
jgi:hypothetical protein